LSNEAGFVRSNSVRNAAFLAGFSRLSGWPIGCTGDEGKAIAEEARREMADHGVVDPNRWLAFHLPGPWGD
jgi:hypothetical protein